MELNELHRRIRFSSDILERLRGKIGFVNVRDERNLVVQISVAEQELQKALLRKEFLQTKLSPVRQESSNEGKAAPNVVISEPPQQEATSAGIGKRSKWADITDEDDNEEVRG